MPEAANQQIHRTPCFLHLTKKVVNELMQTLKIDNNTASNILLAMGHPDGCPLCLDFIHTRGAKAAPPHFVHHIQKDKTITISSSIGFCPRTFRSGGIIHTNTYCEICAKKKESGLNSCNCRTARRRLVTCDTCKKNLAFCPDPRGDNLRAQR